MLESAGVAIQSLHSIHGNFLYSLLVKFYRLNRELGQLQNLYRDVMQQRVDDPQVADKIKAKFERGIFV